MAEPTDLVVIEPDGAMKVVGRGAERRLRDREGRYRLAVDAPGLLILRKEGAEEGQGTRVGMAGELLSRTSVLEVVNVIATAGWRGELHIHDGDSARILYVDQSALKYAWSDHADDRLGQVLFRHGVITRSQLDELLSTVGPERRLGEMLLEKNILTQEQLFAQLQRQIEQIFFAALLARSGTYSFCVPDDDAEPPPHTIHLPIQALLMEGVQRIDEMALFRAKIPNDSMLPEPQAKATQMTLDENSQLVMAWADGNRSIEEISRETGLGQFMTIKSVYGMLQQGALVLRRRREIDEAAVRSLVDAFNEVLRDVFMAVATYGGIDQTRMTLEAWINGSGYGPIFGEKIEEDGSIRSDRVLQALAGSPAEDPLEGLHQALHELAAFALFAATTSLPREQELALSRDVNTRLKRIRI